MDWSIQFYRISKRIAAMSSASPERGIDARFCSSRLCPSRHTWCELGREQRVALDWTYVLPSYSKIGSQPIGVSRALEECYTKLTEICWTSGWYYLALGAVRRCARYKGLRYLHLSDLGRRWVHGRVLHNRRMCIQLERTCLDMQQEGY